MTSQTCKYRYLRVRLSMCSLVNVVKNKYAGRRHKKLLRTRRGSIHTSSFRRSFKLKREGTTVSISSAGPPSGSKYMNKQGTFRNLFIYLFYFFFVSFNHFDVYLSVCSLLGGNDKRECGNSLQQIDNRTLKISWIIQKL